LCNPVPAQYFLPLSRSRCLKNIWCKLLKEILLTLYLGSGSNCCWSWEQAKEQMEAPAPGHCGTFELCWKDLPGRSF